MNKKGFLKALMLSFVVAIAVMFVAGNVMAQVFTSQVMITNGLSVPLDAAGKVIAKNKINEQLDPPTADDNPLITTVLVDNFEYWNNPRNMGWMVQEPPYPVWGAGLGYAQVNNILDFEQGSRVLDVYRQMSVFLMGTGYDVLQISKGCAIMDKNDDTRSIPGANALMSVEVRAPLAIEQFDQFSIVVNVIVNSSSKGSAADTDQKVTIVFRPMEGPMGATGLYNRLDEDDRIDDGEAAKSTIMVALGRMFQDGSWHLVMENLADIVAAYDSGDPDSDTDDAELTAIEAIMVTGNQYRLDNIMFTRVEDSIAGNGAVHLFHIGPVYVQLYGQLVPQGLGLTDPAGRWVMAEDGDLGITAEYGEDGGITIRSIDVDGTGTPYNSDEVAEMTAKPSDSSLKLYEIDPNGNPDLANQLPVLNGVAPEPENLAWIFTMGDTLGPQMGDGFIEVASLGSGPPFSSDEINSWPPYLIQEDGLMIPNMPDPNAEDTGNIYLASAENPMYAIACALANQGYEVFPNCRRIVANLGQVFEDWVVTCRVSDGVVTDKEVFPVSVVNYPVTNNPPIINDVDDQVFYVGMTNYYRIVAIDPDLADMGRLTFNATLNGLPSYQYGPWSQNIIEPCGGMGGLIHFAPQSEGALDCIITVQDPRGMFAVANITIFCVNQGTWFNHPPIILGDLDSPQTIRAGERFIANEMSFVDPDGDKMYWSCNVGSVGNNGVYSFQTQYPGYYLVQITAYDIRGGAATTEFVIHVRPWWSM